METKFVITTLFLMTTIIVLTHLVKTWRLAAAGLEILGFIFSVLTLAAMGLYLVLSERSWAKWLRIFSAASIALAGKCFLFILLHVHSCSI